MFARAFFQVSERDPPRLSVPTDGLCRFRRELERVVPTDPLLVVPFKERLNKGWNWAKEAWRFAQ
jgi:hypothetical protein